MNVFRRNHGGDESSTQGIELIDITYRLPTIGRVKPLKPQEGITGETKTKENGGGDLYS